MIMYKGSGNCKCTVERSWTVAVLHSSFSRGALSSRLQEQGAGGVMLPGNGLVSRDESRRLASKRHAHVHDIYINNAMRPGDKIALGFEKDFYSF